MIKKLLTACAAVSLMVMAGCAIKAPPYNPSIDSVSTIKRNVSSPVSVGTFDVKAGAKGASSVSLRGSGMTSPVGANYADYLADALQRELDMAQRLDPKSSLRISGTLLGTDVDTASGTASGYMEARFVVTKNGEVRFDKTKRADYSWDSSFMGNIAIPAAQANYPLIVQRLLSSLYGDVEFQNVLK